jgi:hypothetical protein
MRLEASCHCGAVGFTVESPHPVPYQLCYCGICRKTQGGSGATINISARADTLAVTGREHTRVYHARLRDGDETRISTAERVFCGLCGSALWLFSPEWPELIHPFASAIDGKLPRAPEHTHMMLGSRPSWVQADIAEHDLCFDEYPDESIAAWHERTGMTR